MDKQGYTDVIIKRPASQAWAAEPTEKKDAIEATLDTALNTIIVAFDFPFVLDQKVDEITVADQAEYVLKGNNSDGRDIMSITFGSDNNLLDKKTTQEHDDWISGLSTLPADTGYWVPLGERQGFPLIMFIGTPSGETTFSYRYRKKNIRVSEFPDVWSGVLIAQVEAELFGSAGMASSEKNFRTADPALFMRTAEKKLMDMIDDYSREAGDQQNYPADLRTRNKNRRRNALFGY